MRLVLHQLLIDTIERDGNYVETAKRLNVSHAAVKGWMSPTNRQMPSAKVYQQILDDYLERHPPQDFDIGTGKTIILMPVRRTVEGRTMATMTKALSHYGRDQVDIIFQFGTDVEKARNILVDRALNTDSQNFIFCDEDAVIPCGYGPYLRGMGYDIPDPNAGLNAIARLLSSPPEQMIVSALCFARQATLVAACSTGAGGGVSAGELVRRKMEPGETGTEPQEWVGMHFCLIRRKVFEDMREKLPEIKPKGMGKPWGYFLKEGPDVGEDASFCRLAASIGHGSLLDTTLRVGHVMQGVV